MRIVVMTPIDASGIEIKVRRLGLSWRGLRAEGRVGGAVWVGRWWRDHEMAAGWCCRARVSGRDGCRAIGGLEEAVFGDLQNEG